MTALPPGKLSPLMASTVVYMIDNGRVLIRREGGYWTVPGANYLGPAGSHGPYAWYAGTTTINGLVKRGWLKVTDWKKSPLGDYPCRVEIVEAMIA